MGREKTTQEKYIKQLENLETGIVVNETYINTITQIKHICPICGNPDWKVAPNKVLFRKSISCGCLKRPWDTEKYKAKAATLGIRVLGEFIDVRTPITTECPSCNKVRTVAPMHILYRGVKLCKECAINKIESGMASALKQVLKHKYTDTIFEYDAGYRGSRGGVSLYDIYIPQLKLLVECQSEYHDDYTRSINDELKREYSLKSGYKFLGIDKRDYTPIQAIQLFFPDMVEIPNYVRLSESIRRATIPIEKAQELLNNKKTIKDVATQLGVGYKIIASSIANGRLVNTKKPWMKHTQTVVQVDIHSGMIRMYNLSDIKRHDTKNYDIKIRIVEACASTTHLYQGYLWYYETDYGVGIRNKSIENQRAKLIEAIKNNNYNKTVIQLTKSGQLIRKYDLSQITWRENPKKYSIKTQIVKACNSNKHEYRGYLWYYESDYGSIIK